MNQSLINALDDSGLSGKELKWEKIRTAKYRFAGLKFLSILYPYLLHRELRVDSIIWDTSDARHNIMKRDDKKNFEIMYYRLLFDCMQKRWGHGSLWGFYPDENSQVDWSEFIKIMDNSASIIPGLPQKPLAVSKSIYSYKIVDFCQKKSIDEPIIQVADLISGLSACSHNRFSELYFSLKRLEGQPTLLSTGINLSNSDLERGHLLKDLLSFCKSRKMHVSFESTNGLVSHDPKMPINFWLYSPQRADDKAPTANGN